MSSSSTNVVDLRSLTTCGNRNILPPVLYDGYVVDPDRDDLFVRIPCMEWAWGLEHGQSELKHELNKIPMRKDMWDSLSQRGWALLPTLKTLRQIIEWSEQQSTLAVRRRRHFLQDFPAGEYEYMFYPCEQFIEDTSIPLWIHEPGMPVEKHDAPYDKLPYFRSTVHPFFVLEHAASSPISWRDELLPETIRGDMQRLTQLWGEYPPTEYTLGEDHMQEDTIYITSQDDFEEQGWGILWRNPSSDEMAMSEPESEPEKCPIRGSHLCQRLSQMQIGNLMRQEGHDGSDKQSSNVQFIFGAGLVNFPFEKLLRTK